MRALTLTQPWAGLVASGIKLVENRPRPMIKREDFGKPFAIHASREIDADVYATIRRIAPELVSPEPEPEGSFTEPWYGLSRIKSAVIAVATIDRVFRTGPRSEHNATDFDLVERLGQARWSFGPVVYLLRDVRALAKPVPCRGYQGFWTLGVDLEAQVESQLNRRIP